MTEKLWIFGDSYSDKEYTYDHSFSSWPSAIEKIYEVTNFSKIGSSPDYSLNILLKKITDTPDDALQHITLIFFISSIYRFNFKFFNIKDHAITAQFSERSKTTLTKNYIEYSSFIKNFFKHYVFHSSYEQSELLKIVGCLNLLSHKFKKVLVWPIFDRISIDVASNKKFYFVSAPLHKIEPWPANVSIDVRNNHMSKNNHLEMMSQLTNWVDNDMIIDINNFNNFH